MKSVQFLPELLSTGKTGHIKSSRSSEFLFFIRCMLDKQMSYLTKCIQSLSEHVAIVCVDSDIVLFLTGCTAFCSLLKRKGKTHPFKQDIFKMLSISPVYKARLSEKFITPFFCVSGKP